MCVCPVCPVPKSCPGERSLSGPALESPFPATYFGLLAYMFLSFLFPFKEGSWQHPFRGTPTHWAYGLSPRARETATGAFEPRAHSLSSVSDWIVRGFFGVSAAFRGHGKERTRASTTENIKGGGFWWPLRTLANN